MMNEYGEQHSRGRCVRDYHAPSRSLNAQWAALCERHLPLRPENSIWRYSRGALPGDPEQGWKLHVPATVLTAGEVLRAVAPLLRGRGVLYKAPASLGELDKLNSGIFYGYSQVGKFLTVYPRTNAEALLLARELYQLTRGMGAPAIPFDLKYRADGCVYYRYGAFKALEVEGHDGAVTYAIRDPEGRFVLDTRDSAARPEWIADPFIEGAGLPASKPAALTPLQTTFKAFRALAQRGRGGVYQALDLSATPPRLCILKEGRRDGEVCWDGRDGFWRIGHERRVLEALDGAGVEVPRVYSSFGAEKNYYLAVEFIEGESLDRWLERRRRRLGVARALAMAAHLARLVARIHSAGWVWRDCKPGNLVITKSGRLRPLDFEGACPVESPDTLPWGTVGYMPPEGTHAFRGQSRLPEDLYALGAVIYLLFAGRTPDAPSTVPLGRVRRNLPRDVNDVVAELLDPDPRRRPGALEAARRLEAALSSKTSARA
ncbi:MAG: hypothetical protein QOE46_3333 [Acidobacteriota bacterium]|jgi:hypothetical protein|nr:hypothetical protein [Acidobacteriota bacterium]